MSGVLFNIGDLEEWKNRIGEWAGRNFPLPSIEDEAGDSRRRMRQALGIVEEYGELMDAYTGGAEDSRKETMDAVADMMIYSLDLCHTCKFPAHEVVSADTIPSVFEATCVDNWDDGHCPAADHLMEGLAVYIGRLAHAALKWEQKIRMSEDHERQIRLCLCHIWRMLYQFCRYNGEDLNALVVKVAEKVTRRDWKANPNDAHEKV